MEQLVNSKLFLKLLNDYLSSSGLSYREVELLCDVDHSYLALMLKESRNPSRDVISSILAFGYKLDRIDVDKMLILAGHAPLGRSVRRRYRQEAKKMVRSLGYSHLYDRKGDPE
jgi:hypothetical protein